MLVNAVLREAFAVESEAFVIARLLVTVESELPVLARLMFVVESELPVLARLLFVVESELPVLARLLFVVESELPVLAKLLFVVDKAPLVDVERVETVVVVEFSAWLVEPIAAELVAVAVVSPGFTSLATALICPCREFLPFLLPRFPEEFLFFFDLAILFVCWFALLVCL